MKRQQKRLIRKSKKAYMKAWGVGRAGLARGKKLSPGLW